MRLFALPDLGEGLREAEILAWHVEVGDHVAADQPLVTVETDKAVVDVPSPRAGRIVRRFGERGEVVCVGAPLVEFETSATDEAARDAGAIVGEIGRAPASAAAPETGGRRVVPTRSGSSAVGARARVRAAPAVRERARQLRVALEALAGSGPGGAITTQDVERAADAAGAARAGGVGGAGSARSAPGAAGAGGGDTGGEPLRGVRRSMARNMARAQAEVARTTVVDEADVGDWAPDENVTARLVRALVAACRAEPALNAWYDARVERRLLHAHVDLGLAVDTPDGLFVPVLRGVDRLDPGAVREQVRRLRDAARQRRLAPEAMRDPTLTLSNFGTLAGRFAMLMLVPPQVAILGAGRIAERVVAVAGRAVVRRQLPLSLTFDHRVVTGGEAARFLAAAIGDLTRAH